MRLRSQVNIEPAPLGATFGRPGHSVAPERPVRSTGIAKHETVQPRHVDDWRSTACGVPRSPARYGETPVSVRRPAGASNPEHHENARISRASTEDDLAPAVSVYDRPNGPAPSRAVASPTRTRRHTRTTP